MNRVSQQPLLIRADASTQIGTGHLMRCLAIAQAWQEEAGHAVFAMATRAPAIEERLRAEGMAIVYLQAELGSTEDAIRTRELAQEIGAPWVVIDGYHFRGEYQRTIKEAGLNLLFIDDYGHAEHYSADLVLNQNIYAHEGLYKNRELYTRLMLGSRYALLRREFWNWQGWKREPSDVTRKVLVTLGGADSDNVTCKVIQALQQVETEDLDVVVVVGGSNPHYEKLQSAVRDVRLPFRLKSNVANMPELMAWADMAITAGGSTCWELAFMGLPALILVLAANQRPIAVALDRSGVAVSVGGHEHLAVADITQAITSLLMAPGMRARMIQRGQELVDGAGRARVLMHLKDNLLRLRELRAEDCRLVWEWNNDPDVRMVSFSSALIPWEEHVAWFERKINDSQCVFYIAVNSDGVPVGQVRYDMDGSEARISISLDRRFRSKGYGSMLIKLASQKLFDGWDIFTIHAYAKPGNEASARAFLKAGFRNVGTVRSRGDQALHFVLQKS